MMILKIFLALGFIVTFSATKANATDTCAHHALAGDWKNIRQEVKTLATLEIIDLCDDKGPYGRYKLRVKETCRPRDCSWGWVGGFAKGDSLIAQFKTFTAVRTIEMAPFADRARITVVTDFISDEKPDTRTAHILVRD